MTKTFTAAAVAIALSFTAIAGSANAAPTYGLTVGAGQTNPFSAVNGR